jgi:hypothetical protein
VIILNGQDGSNAENMQVSAITFRREDNAGLSRAFVRAQRDSSRAETVDSLFDLTDVALWDSSGKSRAPE